MIAFLNTGAIIVVREGHILTCLGTYKLLNTDE